MSKTNLHIKIIPYLTKIKLISLQYTEVGRTWRNTRKRERERERGGGEERERPFPGGVGFVEWLRRS
jgi:hypothetical protein